MDEAALDTLLRDNAPRVYAYARRHIAAASVRTWSPRPSCRRDDAAPMCRPTRCPGSW